ncbi:MAG TPA: P-type conjugative transfer protein TrbJ [Bryobacteraceae bacterium]|jgi:P-type conjugative transfer protein TrbJ|nr:P-type conjugative transfer protein TrbJ [Bryobacteraceae bacterium]
MRKHVIALFVLLAVSANAPQRAEAGAFATEVTQFLNHAQLVLAYIRQGLQLETEIAMLATMLRNTKNLSPQKFGQIQADINALAQIVQGGQALAYSLGNLDQLFRKTYPGYGTNPTVYYMNYQKWSQTTLDTTLGALRAAGLQGQQLQSEQAVINSLESMSQTADGQMQALNVLGQISDQQVQQLMKLRELMMADMSSKQAYQAAIIQQQAANEAAAQWFFTGGPVTSDGKTYLPGLQ